MNTTERSTTILAATLAVLGAGALVVLFVVQRDPQPLWLWVVFAISYVALQLWAVEVSDRLFVSASMMVAFTAAVVFGRDSAILAVALMAAIAVLHPEDIKGRRWRQPAVNFGQLVLSAVIGIAVFLPFLPKGAVTASDLGRLALGAGLAAVVYDWVNFRLVQFIVSRMYPEREIRPWSKMVVNHLALAVLGAYGGVLGAAYVLVGPAILPLIFVAFLVGQMGFQSYSRLRAAHEDTIRGFVKAVEALDPYTRGHTERVAEFARLTAQRLGFDADRLEQLRWAALIHDVGKVAVPADLLHATERLGPDDHDRMVRHMRVVEDVLAGVDFLAPAARIAGAVHELGRGHAVSLESRILGAADLFDGLTSTRSYRVAVTQAEAFGELVRLAPVLGPEVVNALIDAVIESGEVYGSPDEESAAAVARLVRERAIRA